MVAFIDECQNHNKGKKDQQRDFPIAMFENESGRKLLAECAKNPKISKHAMDGMANNSLGKFKNKAVIKVLGASMRAAQQHDTPEQKNAAIDSTQDLIKKSCMEKPIFRKKRVNKNKVTAVIEGIVAKKTKKKLDKTFGQKFKSNYRVFSKDSKWYSANLNPAASMKNGWQNMKTYNPVKVVFGVVQFAGDIVKTALTVAPVIPVAVAIATVVQRRSEKKNMRLHNTAHYASKYLNLYKIAEESLNGYSKKGRTTNRDINKFMENMGRIKLEIVLKI